MMRINFKSLFTILAVGVILIIFKFYYSSLTPEQVVKKFTEAYKNSEDIQMYIVSSDKEALEDSKEDFQNYFPIDFKNEFEIGSSEIFDPNTAIVPLNYTDKVHRISLIKENSQWVINLNLKNYRENYFFSKKLNQLEKNHNEEFLNELKKIQSFTEENQRQILSQLTFLVTKELDDYLYELEEEINSKDYLKNITLEITKNVDNVLFIKVKNAGSKSLSYIKGKILFDNQEIEINIYQILPGNFAYGKPIPPQSTKLIGLNIEDLKTQSKTFKIEPIMVKF